jgi:hypothetical protein
MLRLGHAEDMDLLSRLLESYKRDRAWALLSRGFAHMTKEGLAEFFEAYIRLLQRDFGTKLDDYAEVGIANYWILELSRTRD